VVEVDNQVACLHTALKLKRRSGVMPHLASVRFGIELERI